MALQSFCAGASWGRPLLAVLALLNAAVATAQQTVMPTGDDKRRAAVAQKLPPVRAVAPQGAPPGAVPAAGGSELSMVQLQSVASQRQVAMQTTDNLMQSLNESRKQVAKNIGGGSPPAPLPRPCITCPAEYRVQS